MLCSNSKKRAHIWASSSRENTLVKTAVPAVRPSVSYLNKGKLHLVANGGCRVWGSPSTPASGSVLCADPRGGPVAKGMPLQLLSAASLPPLFSYSVLGPDLLLLKSQNLAHSVPESQKKGLPNPGENVPFTQGSREGFLEKETCAGS